MIDLPDSGQPDMADASRQASDDFVWSDDFLLGFTPMDETHKEFVSVASRLLACDSESAAAAMAELEAHAIRHFGQEEEWMLSTDFPPRDCHIDEHAAVLKSVREVRQALAEELADESLVHDLARHLVDWFPAHADYLDSALAAWMSKQRYGGKPVVLRRGAATNPTRARE